MPLAGDNLGSVIASLGAGERSPFLISHLQSSREYSDRPFFCLPVAPALSPVPHLFPAMQEPEIT